MSKNILVVGYNDYELLGTGWHERSVDGRNGVVNRACSKEAHFWLENEPTHQALLLLVSASPGLAGSPVKLQVFCEQANIGEVEINGDDWQLLSFPLPDKSAGRINFTLKVSPTFIPHLRLKNGDFRELGVFLAAARLI